MPQPRLALLHLPLVGNGMSLKTARLAACCEDEPGPGACLVCIGAGAPSPFPGAQMSNHRRSSFGKMLKAQTGSPLPGAASQS